MKSTKFWILLLCLVLAASTAAALYIQYAGSSGSVAVISQRGTVLHKIDLSQVKEGYELQISGTVENTITVEPGRIRVSHATCPDQVCVHRGWISEGVLPIVCLPNSLEIQIQGKSRQGLDAVAR